MHWKVANLIVNDIGVASMKFYNLHSDAMALNTHNQHQMTYTGSYEIKQPISLSLYEIGDR